MTDSQERERTLIRTLQIAHSMVGLKRVDQLAGNVEKLEALLRLTEAFLRKSLENRGLPTLEQKN